MDDEWINIEGESISLKETPALLRELNLMPIFLKKYYEAKYTKDIIPTEDEQVIFQKYFLKKEGIEDDQSLKNWLSNNHKSEKEMNKILYNYLFINFLKTFFLIIGIFYGFGIILNLFEEIEFFKNLNVSILKPIVLTSIIIF